MLGNENYPNDTAVALSLQQLFKHEDTRLLHEKISSRMVKCASVLDEDEFIGWQMVVPQKGLVKMSVFGSGTLCNDDLQWIVEKSAKTSKKKANTRITSEIKELHEIYLPIADGGSKSSSIGFVSESKEQDKDDFAKWPSHYSSQFENLVQVLQTTGAVLRIVVGSANEDEKAKCRKKAICSFDVAGIPVNDYIGKPVKVRALLALPSLPSLRLKSILEEAIPGAKLRHLGTIKSDKGNSIWNNPLKDADTLPDYAARIMLMEPELSDAVVGIETCEEPVKPIPASHKNTKAKRAVSIGMATDTAGMRRRITIGEMDLKRHYQIVGQTGTGKSTLLANLMLSAIEQGHGLTFFDPHGSTIDVLLRSIPEKYAGKVRVVRIGDVENPVPLNIWDSDDPGKEERNISDLCELFSDIFDPKREGVVGPRYERWLSTFAKASIAALGRRASLESIAVISQSQDNMLKAYKAIVGRHSDLAERIKQEYGLDKSNDFHNTLNWYLCKFERLTSVEQLRKTLGAGTNALDFGNTIDTDTITLIDLASPTIGSHAARIVGTLLLMKLWNAAMARRDRDRMHMVVVDEASLFQTNPMPRMLAEARKFGISVCLCHQHGSQLTQEIRDALEANSASFSAFRLSPKDAANAAIRFDDPKMQVGLPRLDAFRAITTLSVDGKQTAPFTLEVARPKRQKNADEMATRIERESIQKLVEPYRHLKALTPTEIMQRLESMEREPDAPMPVLQKTAELQESVPTYLEDWKKKRSALKKAG